MKARLKVAQLGCGYWGPNLLRNLCANQECEVVRVVEKSPDRLAYLAKNFPSLALSDNPESVFSDPEVEAVVIATPASTHFEVGRQALLADKHILVEKPLAMKVSEARELREISQRTGKVVMVGHTFLYNPAVRYLKKLIDSGELGDVYYLYAQRLNLGQVRSDVNAWWNLAPHDVSILLYLLGGKMPDSIAATGMAFIQKGIEDVVFASLHWEKCLAHIHVSWLDPGKTRRVTVVGSKKMAIYDDVAQDKIQIVDKGVDRIPLAGERMDYDVSAPYKLLHRTGDVSIPGIEYDEPLKLEIQHFIESCRNGTAPLTGVDHAAETIAVLEAGQAALHSNQKQRIEF